MRVRNQSHDAVTLVAGASTSSNETLAARDESNAQPQYPVRIRVCLHLALIGLVSVGCQGSGSHPNVVAKPAPSSEPLPAWTKDSHKTVSKNARQVRIEIKFIELAYDGGSPDIPGKRYEKRLKGSQREAYLRTLAQRKGADLMTAPVILTADGQTAHVEVGRRFRYPDNPQDPDEVTEISLGVSNYVRPRYTADGSKLRLDVLAEVKELEGFHQPGFGPEQPVIATRRLASTVNLADGETIVLGGLVTHKQQGVGNKVPLLGDIPLLGWAFRSQQTYTITSELIVIVTARRVR